MILLKNESPNPEKGSQRFHELDLEKSLVWNMQEQTVIEHPIITIIHRSHANFFLEDNIELSDLFPQEEKTQEEVEEDEEENVLNFHIPSFDQEDKESKKSPAKKLKLSLVSYASSECDDWIKKDFVFFLPPLGKGIILVLCYLKKLFQIID